MNQLRKDDWEIDDAGIAYASQRSIARLCGISQTSINKLVVNLSSKQTLPDVLESYSGQEFRGENLPDHLAEKVIEYYAFDAGRYTTKKAQQVYREFSKIGSLRAAIYNLFEYFPLLSSKLDCNHYIIDRKELLGLKSEGLVTLRTYVYFALRIDGIEKAIQTIDTKDFCSRWYITQNDYLIAIASLSKKGVVNIHLPDLGLRAYSHEEKMGLLQQAINE